MTSLKPNNPDPHDRVREEDRASVRVGAWIFGAILIFVMALVVVIGVVVVKKVAQHRAAIQQHSSI